MKQITTSKEDHRKGGRALNTETGKRKGERRRENVQERQNRRGHEFDAKERSLSFSLFLSVRACVRGRERKSGREGGGT